MTAAVLEKVTNEELARRALAGDEFAKEDLAAKNTRLVHHLAKKFKNTKLAYEDLYRDGLFGLTKAINTYKPDKKIKFATYASMCINNEILQTIRREKKRKNDISLNTVLHTDSHGNGLELVDTLEYVPQENPDLKELNEVLSEAVSGLSERNKKVIQMVLIDDKDQRAAARKFGISQPYVSRIVKKTIQKAKTIAANREAVGKIKEAQAMEKLAKLDFTEELYKEFTKRGLTRQQMADECGVHVVTIYNKIKKFSENKAPKKQPAKQDRKKIEDEIKQMLDNTPVPETAATKEPQPVSNTVANNIHFKPTDTTKIKLPFEKELRETKSELQQARAQSLNIMNQEEKSDYAVQVDPSYWKPKTVINAETEIDRAYVAEIFAKHGQEIEELKAEHKRAMANIKETVETTVLENKALRSSFEAASKECNDVRKQFKAAMNLIQVLPVE